MRRPGDGDGLSPGDHAWALFWPGKTLAALEVARFESYVRVVTV